uniref:NFAM1 Ig-like domain-containing protein n=1 Tax=Panthera leo TaxID=9689 RepID=A0A8C8XJT1_PANLE
MERRPPWCRAPPDPLSGPQLLGLLLFPWTLQLAGGQLVTHIGAPIMVSLANEAISFGCKISYPHSPELKNFTAWYFHVDLQSQRSSEKQINCSSHPVKENQTHSLKCWVTPQLPNASATGTYYCSVHWPDLIRISEGIFILVRDTGYQEPPQGAQKLLLFCFTGLLTLLSILVTALLLWKKVGDAPTQRRCFPTPFPAASGARCSSGPWPLALGTPSLPFDLVAPNQGSSAFSRSWALLGIWWNPQAHMPTFLAPQIRSPCPGFSGSPAPQKEGRSICSHLCPTVTL